MDEEEEERERRGWRQNIWRSLITASKWTDCGSSQSWCFISINADDDITVFTDHHDGGKTTILQHFPSVWATRKLRSPPSGCRWRRRFSPQTSVCWHRPCREPWSQQLKTYLHSQGERRSTGTDLTRQLSLMVLPRVYRPLLLCHGSHSAYKLDGDDGNFRGWSRSEALNLLQFSLV